ncbi:hypothetical protein ABPG75_005140 [Micractinium tetrahymenae]
MQGNANLQEMTVTWQSHSSACAAERFWSFQRWLVTDNRLSFNPETVRKLALASAALRMRRKAESDGSSSDGDVLLQDLVNEEIKNAMQAAAVMAAAEAGTLP